MPTTPNIAGCCWPTVLRPFACALKFDRFQTIRNKFQQVPTLLWFHANGRNKSQHCWAQQCWVLLASNVGSVCMSLKAHANGPNIVGPNNVVTCCVRLHGTTTMLALVAYSLKQVKPLGPCKRTQYCWPTTPNNAGIC